MASSPFKAVLQRTGSSNDDSNAEVTVGSEDTEEPRPKKICVEAVDAVRIYRQKIGTFEQESKDVLDNLERLTEQFERERLQQETKLTNLQQQLASERGLRAAEMTIAKESFKLLKTIFEKDDLNQNNSFNKKQGKQSEKFVGTPARPHPHQVGLVYDERMTQHRNVKKPEHLEKPARITSAYQKLKESGVLDRCLQLDARMATREELLWLHTADYVDELSATTGKKRPYLNSVEQKYESVFLCPQTYQAALLSAGSSMQVVESILSNECHSGVAIIRPPGQHAESDKASGFCFFNNVALAAKYAIEIHHLERILIVDWSIHHGNGIQKMFEEDPRVLYVSLHRLDVFPFNPEKSDCNVVGTGPGTGFTVNIAWPSDGMGDSEYLAAFWRIIMPIANQYNPQLVLVAAGFDAALGDPLGGCKVSPEGYGQMCHMLTSLAEGRVAILLEGGYNLQTTSDCMVMCVRALLKESLRTPKVGGVKKEATAALLRVATYLLPHWSSIDVNIEYVMTNLRACGGRL